MAVVPNKFLAGYRGVFVKALGLEGLRVRSLTIREDVKGPVVVTAEILVMEEQAGKIIEAIKEQRFRLVTDSEASVLEAARAVEDAQYGFNKD